ncbi:PIN domain-containing protein [Cyclobacteriaceae bacterium YHN15]|nr:PIN domain-containing protein [Cyclobacteriaceae bacterium YHN15]
MKRVLLDTDVILDFFFDRKPFTEDAAKVLGLCELKVVTGFITPVILSNVYYLLRQTDKHDKIIDKLRQLMEIIDVLLIDKNFIKQALSSDFKDFEDALQNFSAEKDGQIDVIITRNMKDFKKSKLGVMTPKEYLKLI